MYPITIEADIHTHSVSSGHYSTDTVTSMLKVAKKRGLMLLGISEHGPGIPESCRLSYFSGLASAPRSRMGLQVLYGAEVNIMNDNRQKNNPISNGNGSLSTSILDIPDAILSKLDYAIAGCHVICRTPGSQMENTRAYIKAMENPWVRFISHPDDVKYPVDYEALVQSAIKNNVILEINNSSLSPEGYRGPTKEVLQNNTIVLDLCKQYGHPILLSSDSHGCGCVGDVTYGATLLASMQFPPALVINRCAADLLQWLKG